MRYAPSLEVPVTSLISVLSASQFKPMDESSGVEDSDQTSTTTRQSAVALARIQGAIFDGKYVVVPSLHADTMLNRGVQGEIVEVVDGAQGLRISTRSPCLSLFTTLNHPR